MTLCLPFLMFQGDAQAAIDLYLEAFADAELLEVQHHPEGTRIMDPSAEAASQADGTEDQQARPLVATAQLKVGGQVLMIQDSLVKQDFTFTPAFSVSVVVDTGEAFEHIVGKLSEGGKFFMEPGEYEFATSFAWVQDRFGVSWQVIQPLAPQDPAAQAKAPEWG